jgi:tetratricopeptide (TPR) repeat protein
MKYIFRVLLVTLVSSNCSFAQTGDAKSLTREGVELANQKNYAAAIEKYKAALGIDADYVPGYYQLAYALNATGKGLDGIPYLQKVFNSSSASANLISGAYDLAGSIYDQNHLPKKAIESYQAGIKTNPAYQPFRYNLALAYFRNHQYAEAEVTTIEALKLDSKNANIWRTYALVNFHQNKRAAALLGFCSFLTLEPNTVRSAEAFGNLQRILQGGVLKPEPGEAKSLAIEAGVAAQNKAITKALAPFATRRYASAGDLLTAQLSAVFGALGSMPRDKYYFWYTLADYFGKLPQTNMPAFARLINQTTPENAKWIKANPQQMADLDAWLKANAVEVK